MVMRMPVALRNPEKEQENNGKPEPNRQPQ
jgi:hypothetical protein